MDPKKLEICQRLAAEIFKDSAFFNKFTPIQCTQDYIRQIILNALKSRIAGMEKLIKIEDDPQKNDFISKMRRKRSRQGEIRSQGPEDTPFTVFDVYAFGAFINIMRLMAITGNLNDLSDYHDYVYPDEWTDPDETNDELP
jgi:hypothetical protein